MTRTHPTPTFDIADSGAETGAPPLGNLPEWDLSG